MIGSVNKLLQQNAFSQVGPEKKGNSSSENRSEFEKSLEASNKKATPVAVKQTNNKKVLSDDQQSEPMVQNEVVETPVQAQSNNEDSSVQGESLQNPGKLTPGGERISTPNQFKENGPAGFFSNSPNKVENKAAQNQDGLIVESADSLAKKAAMQNFMKRMKDELGVEPSRVMKAFSSLSVEELTRPPEENVEKIIQSLGLAPEQQLVAKQIFNDMLKHTASQSMADYLKSSGRDLSLNVMTAKEIKQQQLSRSLDDMNSKFFVKNQPAQPMQDLNQMQQDESNALFAAPMMPEMGSAAGSSASSLAAPAQTAIPSNPAMASMMSEMKPVSAKESSQLQAQIKDLLAQNAQPQAAKPTMDLSTSAMSSSKAAINADGMIPVSLLAGEDSEVSEENLMGDGQSSDLQGLMGQQSQMANVDKKDINFAAALDPKTIQQADSANVKELINQAQFLARRGGGEMKIKLNPEGLGEVSMNVALHEGQLHVQMVTDSNEAKKMIERGLGELKATLAAHQLNVDQIKVDSTQTSLEKQMAQNQEDAQRHSARQFMEQFRQDSSGWKRNFYDINPARSYRSQRDEASQPTVPVQAMSDRKSASSRRLNLVA